MTEIRYQETEPSQPAFLGRILILGDKLRMDYGKDEEDFILFDRHEGMVWHVSKEARRLVGIYAGPASAVWPGDWKLTSEKQPSGPNALTQVRVNDKLCVEYKSAPILPAEVRLLRDFRKALAANQSIAWNSTPEDLRDPCNLALDIQSAGIEYEDGLPIAIRYWDGRARVYQSHRALPVNPGLFALPKGYSRFLVGEPQNQKKSKLRQPSSSQRK